MSRKGIMLAYPLEENRLRKWNTSTYILQPKLDGDRCRAIFDASGNVTLLSSEENEINSVPHIKEQLQGMGLSSVELDGELYTHGVAHQDIHGAVSRRVSLHSAFEDVEYHIFDIVSEDVQLKRLIALGEHIPETRNVRRVRMDTAKTLDEIVATMNRYTDMGYEGVIVRHPLATYTRKRSVYMMKFKPRKDDWYTVVGYEEEISIHGEPKNALGALILMDEGRQTFKVGSGPILTREARVELWKQKENLAGRLAHIKYQGLTNKKIPYFQVLVDLIDPRA
jgi:ATP-dependent DNA ligase